VEGNRQFNSPAALSPKKVLSVGKKKRYLIFWKHVITPASKIEKEVILRKEKL